MKTHSNLWDLFIDRRNFASAVFKALAKKKKNRAIREFLKHPAEMTERLRRELIAGNFTTSEYRIKTIFEPKQREIYILPFYPDRIIHHALMNVLIPIWDPMFIRDSYACRPGYGLHGASKRTMDFVRRNKYFLQCDIKKFYPTINHNILMRIVRQKIRDPRLLVIIENIVRSVDGDVNLPIGNFCSQWFGNLYLNELDTFIKHELHCRDYIRYCDDFCLFLKDKKQLALWRDRIADFLRDRLGQRFSYAEVAPVSSGVDFLGYRHFPGAVFLRKSTIKRIRRRLGRIAARGGAQTDREVGQLAAAKGWMKHARAFGAK